MGPRITIIFIDYDQSVELLPFVQYENILRRNIDNQISKYAEMRIRHVPGAVVMQAKIGKAIFYRLCSLLFLQGKEIWIHE